MKYIAIHDPELYMDCHKSWDRRLTIYDSVKGVGPKKAELIKKTFLKFDWLVWFCRNHSEQTAKFIASLSDLNGALTNGRLVANRIGEKLAWNIVNLYSIQYPSSDNEEPLVALQEIVGIIPDKSKYGFGRGGAWSKVWE